MELIVNLEEIKEAGLALERELPVSAVAETLAAEPPTGFTTDRPASLTGRLERVGEAEVVLRGHLEVEVTAPCDRCLDPVNVNLPIDFTLDLVRRDKLDDLLRPRSDDEEAAEVAASFDPAEADQVAYKGKQVDLWPAVREQVLLAVPMGALCREDCKGLCPVCGKNRNLEPCSCAVRVPDPRWDALRNLKV